MEFVNFSVEAVEGGAKRVRQGIVRRQKRGPVRAQDAQIELGVEERDFETVRGRRIAMGLRNAVDEALETQSSKVVGHLRGGVGLAEQCFHVGAEVAIAEAAREMGEGAERLEERHDARVTEPQRGDPLTVGDGGMLQPIEGVLREEAVVA